jgi:hypothetical protein
MLAGSAGRPDIAPEIVARLEPWIDLAEDAVKNVLEKLGLGGIVPARTIAYGINALYVGVDMLSHLEKDDAKAESLFAAARSVAHLFAAVGGSGP